MDWTGSVMNRREAFGTAAAVAAAVTLPLSQAHLAVDYRGWTAGRSRGQVKCLRARVRTLRQSEAGDGLVYSATMGVRSQGKAVKVFPRTVIDEIQFA